MAVTVKYGAPAPDSGNMCYGCQVYCCELNVELTIYDITRIMVQEGREIDSFVTAQYAGPDDLYAFRADGVMNQLALRHEKGACVFFRREEKLKCSIEKSKPSICLAYPFSFRTGKLRNDVLCPKENLAKADRVKMDAGTLEACRWEEERYLEMISDWNLVSDGSENIERFLRFAMSEMELESTFLGRQLRRMKRAIRRLGAAPARKKP